MEKVAIDEVDPNAAETDVERRGLTDPLGATDVAVNHYRVASGEGFPSGLHTHMDQEEIVVVLEGEATFETLVPPSDADGETDADAEREASEVTVGEGEAVRFASGDFQSGRNDADADLVALALGAPRDSEDVRVPLNCPECGHDDLRPEWSEGGAVLVCPDCGAENVPQGCPECGREMRVALGSSGVGESGEETEPNGGAETVVVCPDCGAEAANPW